MTDSLNKQNNRMDLYSAIDALIKEVAATEQAPLGTAPTGRPASGAKLSDIKDTLKLYLGLEYDDESVR
jgi:hypothetical protein